LRLVRGVASSSGALRCAQDDRVGVRDERAVGLRPMPRLTTMVPS